MKTILYILIFNLSLISFAQDPRMFNTTWYLQNVVIGGQDHFPPSNSEVPYVGLSIDDTNLLLETGVCNMGSGTIAFNNFNPSFYFTDGMSVTLSDCDNFQNTVFESTYFNDFFEAGYIDINDLFFYDITDDGNGNLSMVITAGNGNQAIYGNQMLSTMNFDNPEFTIHPNPTHEQIVLSFMLVNDNVNFEIFDSTGKILKKGVLDKRRNHQLDVSNLSGGIYFLKINTKSKNVAVKKFVKQ